MPKRVTNSVINASTIKILNTIRRNASYEYQQSIPEVTKVSDIPKVGEVLWGNPALLNRFMAGVNQIALISIQNSTYNNPYKRLHKGVLTYGETIEEIFIGLAKVVNFDPEKAPAREFKRTLPDSKAAFHAINWRVMYPVTVDSNEVNLMLQTETGVTDLIAKITETVYNAAEYDEFLLTKYMMIKSIAHGEMYPVGIGDGTDLKEAAKQYRGMSNMMTFMRSEFNRSAVKNTTPKERQIIFMDAAYNAEYDVEVLSAAFNMDKATYSGSLFLIDSFATFDNDRWAEIREQSDGLEEVTEGELELMRGVKAVLIDEQWFQFYDNLNKFTEQYAASGLYWNYFYHQWKTVSSSPFANAIVFALDSADIALPDTVTVEITARESSDVAVAMVVSADVEAATLKPSELLFTQTQEAVVAGVAITPDGEITIPANATATDLTLEGTINGVKYKASTTINSSSDVGTIVEMTKA